MDLKIEMPQPLYIGERWELFYPIVKNLGGKRLAILPWKIASSTVPDRPDGYLAIQVSDHGIGIDKDQNESSKSLYRVGQSLSAEFRWHPDSTAIVKDYTENSRLLNFG